MQDGSTQQLATLNFSFSSFYLFNMLNLFSSSSLSCFPMLLKYFIPFQVLLPDVPNSSFYNSGH